MRHPDLSPSFRRRRAAFGALLLTVLLAVPALARAGRCCDPAHGSAAEVVPIVLPALPPILPVPVVVAAMPHAHGLYGHRDHGTSDDDGFSWALIGDHADRMNGDLDDDDREALKDLSRAGGAPVLWFRLDGDAWVVRDRALVQKADQLLEPMRELGAEMGRVGSQQGRLGARQGRLGAWQGRYGTEVGRLAARLAAVELRLAAAGMGDDEDALTPRERAALAREVRELDREQRELARRYPSAEADEMGDLGRQMGELGRQLAEMGRRMGELSRRADRELRDLAREAIATRRAERFGGRS